MAKEKPQCVQHSKSGDDSQLRCQLAACLQPQIAAKMRENSSYSDKHASTSAQHANSALYVHFPNSRPACAGQRIAACFSLQDLIPCRPATSEAVVFTPLLTHGRVMGALGTPS